MAGGRRGGPGRDLPAAGVPRAQPVPRPARAGRAFARRWGEDGFSLWAADELATGRFVGRIGLMRHHDWPESESPVEVGWVLHRDWWGRGLATEGGAAGVECWREHLDDPQLIAITSPANRRSHAVMERLEMTHRGATHWHGHDVVWYALDR